MGEQNPFLFRNDLDQVPLDLHRFGVFGQIEPARDALHMRVHHDAGGDTVRRAQHYVGRLARRTWNRQQFLYRPGNLSPEIAQDLPRGSHNGLRFIVEETGTTDILRQYFRAHSREIFRRWILGK